MKTMENNSRVKHKNITICVQINTYRIHNIWVCNHTESDFKQLQSEVKLLEIKGAPVLVPHSRWLTTESTG